MNIDHTLQTSDGWYIDTSDLKVNQTARLISTNTTIPRNGICFRFWYRAYGSKQGKLNVLQKASNGQNATLIYTARPNIDIDWREAIVYRATLGNYQFILEGILGNVFTDSDNIGIDDITTSEGILLNIKNQIQLAFFSLLGPCPSQRFCAFESEDLCGYVHDSSGNFNWTRHQGSTTTWFTGPPYDHTTLTSEGIEENKKNSS